MIRYFRLALVCFLILVGGSDWLKAQGTEQQYRDAASYRTRVSGRVYRDSVVPRWIDQQETKFWYRVSVGPKRHVFRLVDCLNGQRIDAFDHQKLAEHLSEATGQEIDPQFLDLRSLRISEDAEEVRFEFSGRSWVYSRTSDQLRQPSSNQPEPDLDRLIGLKSIARSRSGGSEVDLEITNNTRVALIYYWVRSDGSLQRYGMLQPGARATLNTYVGHAWLLKNSEGKPVASFVASEDQSRAIVDDATPQPMAGVRSQTRRNPNQSPDGKWLVRYDDKSIVIESRSTSEQFDYEWLSVNDQFKQRQCKPGRVWWSPNSSHFVMMPATGGDQRQVSMVESSPKESIHPILHQFRYAKPGDELDHPIPTLFSLENQWEPKRLDDSDFPNPYAINRVTWDESGETFSFLYNERGHQSLRLITVDATTASPRICIDESSDTFVCYSQKTFLHRVSGRNEWIWMSERSGWNHLYLIDANTGLVKNAITSGDWVVRSVENVDEVNREILLSVSGMNEGEDPYHKHLIRVSFDGKRTVQLTQGDGDHRWRFSPKGKWLIDEYSRVDLPPITTLRSVATGELVCELEKADISELVAMGWRPPERFVTEGRDGVTKIHGLIIRPLKFDSEKKYPVLEHIYAGPHSSFVPKSFGLHHQLYEMAELGFIVVKIDGMGTSNRSKAFHDVCWQNLGDSGFPDRVIWMEAAAQQRPEMDLERVGIWGGSAGGQSAMRALITHGDFYDAASADCGCHDNRVDKIWWNEQWMGWPIGPHYAQQSNVTQAHRVNGDLLLIWGEMDRNVDPSSSMQVVDALIKADKDFTQLIVPGAGHGAAAHPYAKRQQADFFVRKLWGKEPRSE